MRREIHLAALVAAGVWVTGGCAAAVGAAAAAGNVQRGMAGVRELVASSRSVVAEPGSVAEALSSPLTGTYRGARIVGADTVVYYVRTVTQPTAPIVDSAGRVTGYVLAGLAATSLDTLEARIGRLQRGEEVEGTALFFVEGTRTPEAGARTLYPAAYLGRLPEGESAAADRQEAVLGEMEVELQAPDLEELVGQGIPHELFRRVADGVFTLAPGGDARFEQEYSGGDGRTLTLRFERISGTTLPEPRWLSAGRIAEPPP